MQQQGLDIVRSVSEVMTNNSVEARSHSLLSLCRSDHERHTGLCVWKRLEA